MKSKLILSGLFLTGAVSCASFKPFVLTDAFVDPSSITAVDYDDLNFSYALFNQYASALSYELKMNYSNYYANQVNFGFGVANATGYYPFQDWDFVGSSQATAVLDSVWANRINSVLFNRDFDTTTREAITTYLVEFSKWPLDSVNLEISVISKIKYNVNVGSLYLAYTNNINAGMDGALLWIDFYNGNQILQNVLLSTTNNAGVPVDYLFGLGTIITGVDRFVLRVQYVDTPPFATGFSTWWLHEFNLFTQGAEISIPVDTDGDRFGFEFVAVEWWNILGHLQNFAWWIVNQSPVAPIFEWIDDYIITWVSGLITFITGIFRL